MLRASQGLASVVPVVWMVTAASYRRIVHFVCIAPKITLAMAITAQVT